MYVTSRQGYKPPVKSTGRGKKYSHFASLKYCNGARDLLHLRPTAWQGWRTDGAYQYIQQQAALGKKFQLANVKDVIGDVASYGSDPRRTQYAGSETDGLNVDHKGK